MIRFTTSSPLAEHRSHINRALALRKAPRLTSEEFERQLDREQLMNSRPIRQTLLEAGFEPAEVEQLLRAGRS